MPVNKIITYLFLVLFLITIGVLFVWPKQNTTPDTLLSPPLSISPQPFSTTQMISPLPTDNPASPQLQTTYLYQPTADFKTRVTKKPFAIYVTPTNSPVSPERFTGFHTGADAEYEDTAEEITVHAISDGTVRSSRRANGYGGIVVIEHIINSQALLVIYGHLDPSNLIQANASVEAGQQIGVLGEGYSDETDGERKHLHLAILKSTTLNVSGYVKTSDELEAWLDPLSLF
jgi:murein DD-endopeptidase MepM/ murein hydrolase activator NlpD